jgi:glutamyl-tRNA reductase
VHYQVVSFNYKKCDLTLRERLAFNSNDEIKRFLDTLLGFDFMLEAFVINTCNRVEIVTASKDNFATFHAILGLLSRESGINFHSLVKSASRFEDKEAIKHIFSVVSSLDSLVIGEAQITGQVKQGFKISAQNGTASKELERVLNYALKCASKVRNVTNISENPISIASVAVAQAVEVMGGSLAGMTGVVVGTGEMGRLTTKHLLRAGADVLLVSRDINKAQKLADELGENVRVGSFGRLGVYINRYRLIFSATASPTPIITANMLENSDIQRVWFDIAIPRDIEDIDAPKLKIYRIDDLQDISKNNYAIRQEQAVRAYDIVKDYTDEFYRWLQALSVEPVIKELRLKVDKIVKNQVQRAIKKGFIPREYQKNIEYLVSQSFDEFLHQPTKNLRKFSKDSEKSSTIEGFKEIFEIDTTDVDPNKYQK